MLFCGKTIRKENYSWFIGLALLGANPMNQGGIKGEPVTTNSTDFGSGSMPAFQLQTPAGVLKDVSSDGPEPPHVPHVARSSRLRVRVASRHPRGRELLTRSRGGTLRCGHCVLISLVGSHLYFTPPARLSPGASNGTPRDRPRLDITPLSRRRFPDRSSGAR